MKMRGNLRWCHLFPPTPASRWASCTITTVVCRSWLPPVAAYKATKSNAAARGKTQGELQKLWTPREHQGPRLARADRCKKMLRLRHSKDLDALIDLDAAAI
jgi:hypothetical protein